MSVDEVEKLNAQLATSNPATGSALHPFRNRAVNQKTRVFICAIVSPSAEPYRPKSSLRRSTNMAIREVAQDSW